MFILRQHTIQGVCSYSYIESEPERGELSSKGKDTLFSKYKRVYVLYVCVLYVCVPFLSHFAYSGLDELQRDARNIQCGFGYTGNHILRR
jgi:hypothetical protein